MPLNEGLDAGQAGGFVQAKRPLLTFDDLDDRGVSTLLDLCHDLCVDEQAYHGALGGRFVGLMFNKPSTRTRMSFWRSAQDLGAGTVCIDESITQLSTGESHSDTGRVLGLYLDGLVMRSNGPLSEMRALAEGCPGLVNAMSSCEHPTQALADYAAMYKKFGDLRGIHIAYFGEGNNTVSALTKLFSHVPGCTLHLYMPQDFSLDAAVVSRCAGKFQANGGALIVSHDTADDLPRADVVYCTRWRTMGVGHKDPDWLSKFDGFKMTPELFDKVAADGGVFMHDLPAVREEDVSSEVLDGSRSIVWSQASCKRIGASAALLFSMGSASRP